MLLAESKINDVPESFIFNEDEFMTSVQGTLFHAGNEVMNCIVKIDRIICSEKKTLYECSIYIQGRILQRTINARDFCSDVWLRSKVPGFATCCEKNLSSQLIYKYLNALVRKSGLNNLQEVIKKPGWIKVENMMVYVTPKGTIPNLGYPIMSEYGQNFGVLNSESAGQLHSFLKLSKLTPKTWTASIILLYTVMSFSYTLYKESGLLIKFLLFVNGPRGCYKTSLSLLMTQIERTSSPEYNLKAKSAGLETGYKKFKDAVMQIDDLAPTQEIHERKQMQSNLEMVVRAFGDGTGKKRNYDFIGPDCDVEQYEAEGGAIITGEYVVGCESSLARCLLLPLARGDVDTQLMTQMQETNRVLPVFLIGYIEYLSSHYLEIVGYIQERGKEYRNRLVNQFSNARYGEYYAQLMVAAEILLLKYGCKTNQMCQNEAEEWLLHFKMCIEQAIEYNDRSLVEEAPITVLCRAIVIKLESNMYPIVSRNTKIDNSKRCVLESEDTYYIRADDIFAMKKSYDNENGICGIEYKATGLANLLCDFDVAPRFQEGKSTRTGRKIGNARYMEINKRKLYELANI